MRCFIKFPIKFSFFQKRLSFVIQPWLVKLIKHQLKIQVTFSWLMLKYHEARASCTEILHNHFGSLHRCISGCLDPEPHIWKLCLLFITWLNSLSALKLFCRYSVEYLVAFLQVFKGLSFLQVFDGISFLQVFHGIFCTVQKTFLLPLNAMDFKNQDRNQIENPWHNTFKMAQNSIKYCRINCLTLFIEHTLTLRPALWNGYLVPIQTF